MRVNIYAEEMTDRIEIIGKEIDGETFTGLRMYLDLPTTLPDGTQAKGPFLHRLGDDDSSAVTFWGKRDLRQLLEPMLAALDEHYHHREPYTGPIGHDVGGAIMLIDADQITFPFVNEDNKDGRAG